MLFFYLSKKWQFVGNVNKPAGKFAGTGQITSQIRLDERGTLY